MLTDTEKLVYNHIKQHGYTKAADIANAVGIRHVSNVTPVLALLVAKGYLEKIPLSYIIKEPN